MKTPMTETLLWLTTLLAVDYVAVLAAVIIDLRSGISAARRRGEKRNSKGYRRSVDKLARYFVTLLSLSVIDALVIISAILLRTDTGWSIPLFPIFTTAGATALALIEAKSVMENSQRRADSTDAADAATGLLDDESLHRLIDALRRLSGKPKQTKP